MREEIMNNINADFNDRFEAAFVEGMTEDEIDYLQKEITLKVLEEYGVDVDIITDLEDYENNNIGQYINSGEGVKTGEPYAWENDFSFACEYVAEEYGVSVEIVEKVCPLSRFAEIANALVFEQKKNYADNVKEIMIRDAEEKYGAENRETFLHLWESAIALAEEPDEDMEWGNCGTFNPLVKTGLDMTIYDNPLGFEVDACDEDGDYVIRAENEYEGIFAESEVVEDPEDPVEIFEALVELLGSYSMNAYENYNDDVILDEIANDIKYCVENDMNTMDYDRNGGDAYEWDLDKLNGFEGEIEKRAGLEPGTLKYNYTMNGYTFEW